MFVNYKIFVILLISLLFYNCKSTATVAQIENLKRVVNERNIEITANSATPIAFANTRGLENLLPPGSNLANINLINTPNFIKIQKDSLQVDLPYFGELRIVSGYNSESGIHFDGIPTKTTIGFNEKRMSHEIMYDVKSKNETFRISITLFSNNRSSFIINSSNRTTISYDGTWKELKSK